MCNILVFTGIHSLARLEKSFGITIEHVDQLSSNSSSKGAREEAWGKEGEYHRNTRERTH